MRNLLHGFTALCACLAAALLPLSALAEAPAQMLTQSPPQSPQMAQLLFVQNASSVELDAERRTLTLKGVSPTTLFFSDRPVRIAGHYRTEEYLQFWKNGPDSFLKDPPNATLSVFETGKDELVDVVVTLRNPRVAGNDLSYDVTVIAGVLPAAGGPASLFIDIIGMPFTPLSFAGVARRTAYRTVVWGSAAAATSAAAASAAAASRPPPPTYAAPVPAPTAVPVATINVNETVQGAPAKAAPTANNQAAISAKLKELKSLQQQGLITAQQYQQESQKLLNQLLQ
jgi:hypothetical protein